MSSGQGTNIEIQNAKLYHYYVCDLVLLNISKAKKMHPKIFRNWEGPYSRSKKIFNLVNETARGPPGTIRVAQYNFDPI